MKFKFRKKIVIIIISLLIIPITIFICARGKKENNKKIDDLLMFPVIRGEFKVIIREIGVIHPLIQVDIKSKVAGQIEKVLVEEGDIVKKGDTLIKLDSIDFVREVSQAEANMKIAKARLDLLMAGSRSEEIKKAEAEKEKSRIQSLYAKQEWERKKKSFADKIISQQELDQAEKDYQLEEANYKINSENYKIILNGPRPEEIAQAKAEYERTKVLFQAAQDRLNYTTILSPIDGTVIYKDIEIGEIITPGTASTFEEKPLLTIADLNELIIKSEFNQIDVAKIKLNDNVEITVDALPKENFKGVISKISPSASLTPEKLRIFKVETLIEKSENLNKLKPGMTANINVVVYIDSNALMVPIESVRLEKGQYFVTVVNPKDNSKEVRKVEVGESSEEMWQIISGVEEGENVLITPPDVGKHELKL